jgi:hypothetical protein
VNRYTSKFIVLLACLLLAQSIGSQMSLAQESIQLIKTEYDGSKDLTQITLNPIILASKKLEELRLGAVTGYPGKVKSKPKEIALIFLSLSKTDENRYEASRKLSVVADERHFNWGEVQRTKQAQGGLFLETMTTTIPMDDFLFVASAKQVRIKLGLTEVELGAAQLSALKLMASYVSE